MIIKMNGTPIGEVTQSIGTISQFRTDFHTGGLFYAITGETFKQWFFDIMHSLGEFIYNSSDVLVVAALVAGLLALSGSKRSYKWLYWIVIGYILIKFLGGAVL